MREQKSTKDELTNTNVCELNVKQKKVREKTSYLLTDY